MVFCLLFVVLLDDALVVRLNHVLGDALHSKNLIFQTCAARDGILDLGERFLVDLCHVHIQTTCSIQPPATSVAFEVLCLLVIDENLQIIKVALTIVAPRTRENLLNVGVVPLFLAHVGD